MLDKYNETLLNLDNLTPFQRQKAYMQIAGQINEHGGVLVPTDYVHFTKTEIAEFFTAYVKDDKTETLDALCDIMVCALGVIVMKGGEEVKPFIRHSKQNELIRNIVHFPINGDHSLSRMHNLINNVYSLSTLNYNFNFDKALLEVFRNNFARLQFDENGNVLKQPEFLPDGSKNPDAGKVIKKPNLNPDLRPFLTK
jgi:hypothetical protein